MIKFEDVSIQFEQKYVLHHFNMDIQSGEKILIYGRSGIGKSTIFKLLLGFIAPESGTIYFNNQPLNKKNIWDVRKKVAYVSQNIDIGGGKILELFQNILLYRANAHLSFKIDDIKEQLDYWYLSHDVLEKDLTEISGGERQRIALIIAILLKRDIFILDEVTSSVDMQSKQRIVEYFKKPSQWTVIVISHDQIWLDQKEMRVIKIN